MDQCEMLTKATGLCCFCLFVFLLLSHRVVAFNTHSSWTYPWCSSFHSIRTTAVRHQQIGSLFIQQHSQSEQEDNQQNDKEQEVDVIVIGSGIGGLSCAALSSKYGFPRSINEPG